MRVRPDLTPTQRISLPVYRVDVSTQYDSLPAGMVIENGRYAGTKLPETSVWGRREINNGFTTQTRTAQTIVDDWNKKQQDNTSPMKNLTYPHNGGIGSGFFRASGKFHGGLDIGSRANFNQLIVATRNATVAIANHSSAGLLSNNYGNYVTLYHGKLQTGVHKDRYLYTLYGHMNSVSVTRGQLVRAGTELGRMGHTGITDPVGLQGTHLHWEMFISPTGFDKMYNSTYGNFPNASSKMLINPNLYESYFNNAR